jgi:hypothetical protein
MAREQLKKSTQSGLSPKLASHSGITICQFQQNLYWMEFMKKVSQRLCCFFFHTELDYKDI